MNFQPLCLNVKTPWCFLFRLENPSTNPLTRISSHRKRWTCHWVTGPISQGTQDCRDFFHGKHTYRTHRIRMYVCHIFMVCHGHHQQKPQSCCRINLPWTYGSVMGAGMISLWFLWKMFMDDFHGALAINSKTKRRRCETRPTVNMLGHFSWESYEEIWRNTCNYPQCPSSMLLGALRCEFLGTLWDYLGLFGSIIWETLLKHKFCNPISLRVSCYLNGHRRQDSFKKGSPESPSSELSRRPGAWFDPVWFTIHGGKFDEDTMNISDPV